MCCTCDQLQVQFDSASDALITEQKEDHLRRAGFIAQCVPIHKEIHMLLSFRWIFSKIYPFVGEVFYMHQIWVYVLGTHLW